MSDLSNGHFGMLLSSQIPHSQQIQSNPCNVSTLWNERTVVIIEVSSFQGGGGTLVEKVDFNYRIKFKSDHIIKMSTFLWCPQGGVPLYHNACYL